MTSSNLIGSTFFGIDISSWADLFLTFRRRISKRVLLLEFRDNSIYLAEASLAGSDLQLQHISQLKLPEDALDRGVPADPQKMSVLLRDLCREKKIPAHRASVVLSPQVAFKRIVNLPSNLSLFEAREYILNPLNGLQLPFPISQTDFDLFPISAPCTNNSLLETRRYLLTAVPQVLVDKVIDTLKYSDFELQSLELGCLSQLRCIAAEIVTLGSQQIDCVIELLPNASTLYIVTSSGLYGSCHLPPIREFPTPELQADEMVDALNAGLSAESFVVGSENYLPITNLDLRVLFADIKTSLSDFSSMIPGAELRSFHLTGVNSAHPLLADLFKNIFGVPVNVIHPLLSQGIEGYSAESLIVQADLSRLIGLGLGLLPSSKLLSCTLPLSISERSKSPSSGLLIEELLDVEIENDDWNIYPSQPNVPVDETMEKNDTGKILPPSRSAVDSDQVDHDPLPQFRDSSDVHRDNARNIVPPERDSEPYLRDEVKDATIADGLSLIDRQSLSDDENRSESLIAARVVDSDLSTDNDQLHLGVQDDLTWPSIPSGGLDVDRAANDVFDQSNDESLWPTINHVKADLVSESDSVEDVAIDSIIASSNDEDITGLDVHSVDSIECLNDESEWPSISPSDTNLRDDDFSPDPRLAGQIMQNESNTTMATGKLLKDKDLSNTTNMGQEDATHGRSIHRVDDDEPNPLGELRFASGSE